MSTYTELLQAYRYELLRITHEFNNQVSPNTMENRTRYFKLYRKLRKKFGRNFDRVMQMDSDATLLRWGK